MDLLDTVLIEPEQFLVAPYISTVLGHVHRKVTHEADPEFMAIVPELIPLHEEVVLIHGKLVHFPAIVLGKHFDQLCRISELVLIRPLVPRLPIMHFLEDIVQDILTEPVHILPAEFLVSSVIRQFIAVDHHRISGKSRVA